MPHTKQPLRKEQAEGTPHPTLPKTPQRPAPFKCGGKAKKGKK